MSKTARGALLLMAGLILVAAASLIYVLQDRQDRLAGQNAAILLNELERELAETQPTQETKNPLPEEEQTSAPNQEEGGAQPELPPMPTASFSGYSMIGRLSIPSVGLCLPILSSWDEQLLKVAPCRYAGSAEGEDLILLGHNYRAHFKALMQVDTGASVEFAAADATVYRYRVDAVDIIRGSDVQALADEHELILFTCTADRLHRLVVRCSRVEG